MKLLGDVPMFVAHDGSDVWAHQAIFQLDDHGERRVVAGVPPDYFSARRANAGATRCTTGRAARNRLCLVAGSLSLHARALRRAAPGPFHRLSSLLGNPIARHRARVMAGSSPCLGRISSRRYAATLGHLPFIAEDLGLAHARGGRAARPLRECPACACSSSRSWTTSRDYQPHRFPKQTVVYTGTHDNDTVVGWLTSHKRARAEQEVRALREERQRALRLRRQHGNEPHWDMIRVALMSVANTAISRCRICSAWAQTHA